MFNRGMSANTKTSVGKSPEGVKQLSQIMSKVKGAMQVGRVTDIILDPLYPNIEKFGGMNGIGTIFFELNNFISDSRGTAKPLFPQTSAYPLVNEMVLIFKLPSTKIGNKPSEETYYYINMISLWNHPHHNAYPNLITTSTLPDSQQKDYEQTEAGSVRRVTDESTDIEFNSPINPSQATFKERTNIHPLLPFAGDIMYQGRWGNSIRFGSTAKPSYNPPKSPSSNFLGGSRTGVDLDALNDWSEVGENGDPITIIRNGQPKESSDEGWVPITENINTDLSSIYQTSTQQIPIEVKNLNYSSYSTPPEAPDNYTKPQVIINSDRLIFNAKSDHILLSAEKSIFLGSNSSINISTKECIVDSTLIKLGKDATESIIKGDRFLGDLEAVMKELSTLCIELGKIKEVTIVDTTSGVPTFKKAVNGSVSSTANNLKRMIDETLRPNMLANGVYKSEKSKTQ